MCRRNILCKPMLWNGTDVNFMDWDCKILSTSLTEGFNSSIRIWTAHELLHGLPLDRKYDLLSM